MENIISFIIDLFSGIKGSTFGREIIVFIISMMPILELRGGLIASALLELNPFIGYVISIVGNILPVPFILLFISKILDWMEKSNNKFFHKLASSIRRKADKHKGKIEKYGYLGLVLFVGIPLPGTGAWTGCLIASLLNLNRKKAFLCTIAGIFIASVIMMIISYGIISNLIN